MENLSPIIRKIEHHIKTTVWNGDMPGLQEMSQKLVILKKYRDIGKPRTPEEKKELLSLLCYSNLGFCCGLEKGCIWRNSVLAIYEIKPSDYKRKKEEFGDKLLEGDE